MPFSVRPVPCFFVVAAEVRQNIAVPIVSHEFDTEDTKQERRTDDKISSNKSDTYLHTGPKIHIWEISYIKWICTRIAPSVGTKHVIHSPPLIHLIRSKSLEIRRRHGTPIIFCVTISFSIGSSE
jgi:hypothetical protein